MTIRFTSLAILVVIVTLFSEVALAQQFQTRVKSYGLALPKDNVTLRSNIDSHVTKILVQEGQHVKQGDVLVELNCESALARKEIAQLAANELGALMNAEAELKFAQTDCEKLERLFSRKAINTRELGEARLRLERAEAQLQTAIELAATNQAKLELANAELEDHYLRAPFDGQVVEVKVSPGCAVTSAEDILQVISTDMLQVDLYLSLDESQELKVGDVRPLTAQEPFGNKVIDGTVRFCSPLIEAASGARRVTLEIDNRDLQLPAGFTVTIANQ